ncbi:MAG: antibiotic biosynthesis monooxygenase [Anaerolineae bacterium]|jgi:quinol monooxygenase YgiN|nr:antibiotic biosynthesis monooxygenase [Anaerolineae bacterium]MDH7472773.1 antibiotic biosynthesis monooxygenase [Anaerolineae bacterium]
MVLYVVKWDVHPDKAEAYVQFTQSAIQRTLAVPGVVEFRAYRPAAGASQALVTYEFADLATWAAWYAHEEAQNVLAELRTLTLNVTTELWGPSPLVPKPIRPGG